MALVKFEACQRGCWREVDEPMEGPVCKSGVSWRRDSHAAGHAGGRSVRFFSFLFLKIQQVATSVTIRGRMQICSFAYRILGLSFFTKRPVTK